MSKTSKKTISLTEVQSELLREVLAEEIIKVSSISGLQYRGQILASLTAILKKLG